MSLVTLRCPSCGATAQLPPGRKEGFCIYCGNKIVLQLSEADSVSVDKDRDFITEVNAAIACIKHGEYASALEYADKAAQTRPGMPAPILIKSICHMDKDFKKAISFYEISKAMWEENGSLVLTDEIYKNIIASYADNYLDDRCKDLKRMVGTIHGVKPSDIENVKTYEYRKRLNNIYTIPDIKTIFIENSSKYADSVENKYKFTDESSEDNLDLIREFTEYDLFRLVASVFVNPDLVPIAKKVVSDFDRAANLKWESAFRQGMAGSKDEIRRSRNFADIVSDWLRYA